MPSIEGEQDVVTNLFWGSFVLRQTKFIAALPQVNLGPLIRKLCQKTLSKSFKLSLFTVYRVSASQTKTGCSFKSKSIAYLASFPHRPDLSSMVMSTYSAAYLCSSFCRDAALQKQHLSRAASLCN